MKMKASILFPLISLCLFWGLAQSSQVVDGADLRTLLGNRQFIFEANRASPLARPSLSTVTIPSYLKINRDSTEAHLPYFGEMRLGGGYGEGGPIKFNSKIEDYKVKWRKKGRRAVVSFNSGSNGERFIISLSINGKRSVTAVVRSSHRNSISYYGELKPLEEDPLD